MWKYRKFAAAAVGTIALAVAGIVVVPALATPGSGFVRTPLSGGHFGELDVKAVKVGHWDLFLKTKDATDITVDRLTVAPGGFSGWHSHVGPVFVTVVSGEITVYQKADCSYQTYRAGDAFIEKAQRAHFVKNNTGTPAEFVAIQIVPTGALFRVDEQPPTTCSI